MLNAIIIIVSLALASYLAFSRKLSSSSNWKATVTPLASIMGSGFLISAPLLGNSVGNLAVFCMGILLLLSYMIGGAMRFNIQYFEPVEHKSKGIAQNIAFTSRVVLIGAYFISITYYLQLLAAFLLNIFNVENDLLANVITSSLILLIGGIGIWKGLDKLEVVEKYAVSLNLGMIGALLLGLLYHNLYLLISNQWGLPDISSSIDFGNIRVLLGLLIVVQGFETSRYLGDEHPAEQRITTMRNAQLISMAIYLVFIGLSTVLFTNQMGADVTAIMVITKPVAVVLPALLGIAAIGSQFSAAVADNSGAGGLLEDITNRKLPVKYAYIIIMLVALTLAWETDVNQIIAYASRAFALYYTMQCMVAFFVARQTPDISKKSMKMGIFLILAIICLLVFMLGIPAG